MIKMNAAAEADVGLKSDVGEKSSFFYDMSSRKSFAVALRKTSAGTLRSKCRDSFSIVEMDGGGRVGISLFDLREWANVTFADAGFLVVLEGAAKRPDFARLSKQFALTKSIARSDRNDPIGTTMLKLLNWSDFSSIKRLLLVGKLSRPRQGSQELYTKACRSAKLPEFRDRLRDRPNASQASAGKDRTSSTKPRSVVDFSFLRYARSSRVA